MSEELPSTDTGQSAQFEGIAPDARRYRSPLARFAGYLIPFALAVALIVSATRSPGASGAAKVPLTVATNVPWAAFSLDGGHHRYAVNEETALPSATVMVTPGAHLISAFADGFMPASITAQISASGPEQVMVELRLSADATPGILAAVNQRFASSGYDERVALPAADWQLLGVPHAPQSAFLIVRDALVATSLDPILPIFRQSNPQRPVPPTPGAVGVAVIVVEHTEIYDGCSSAPLVQRTLPLISPWTASMTFSLHQSPLGWSVDSPYVLNPQRNDYTSPDQAATAGSPVTAYTLAARSALASALGNSSLLAAAASPRPQSGPGWNTGLILQITGTSSTADWLFAGGALTALTPDAARLTSGVPQTALALAQQVEANGLGTYGPPDCITP